MCSEWEYVHKNGDGFSDVECRTITNCGGYAGMFQLAPPIDSNSSDTLGSDALCSNYTECAPGHGVVDVGGIEHVSIDPFINVCTHARIWGFYSIIQKIFFVTP